mmetsp:Transcript_112895/g.299929  ORF Transcript_112895/g.299929 Transcript_112895/m.299929 type:complete len:236 (-) Transcript_112895:2-709(-)
MGSTAHRQPDRELEPLVAWGVVLVEGRRHQLIMIAERAPDGRLHHGNRPVCLVQLKCLLHSCASAPVTLQCPKGASPNIVQLQGVLHDCAYGPVPQQCPKGAIAFPGLGHVRSKEVLVLLQRRPEALQQLPVRHQAAHEKDTVPRQRLPLLPRKPAVRQCQNRRPQTIRLEDQRPEDVPEPPDLQVVWEPPEQEHRQRRQDKQEPPAAQHLGPMAAWDAPGRSLCGDAHSRSKMP